MIIVQIGANVGNDHVYRFVQSLDDTNLVLLIEPNEIIIPDLQDCYKDIKNVQIERVAITKDDTIDSVEFFFSPAMYPPDAKPTYALAALSREHLVNSQHPVDTIKSTYVPATTINKVLEKYNLTDVDYLFIDTEGLDGDIINSINFDKFNIKNIEFEYHHLPDYGQSIAQYLLSLGYTFRAPFGSPAEHNYDYMFTKEA